MNKKILDVTVTIAFCICLIVTANIEEKNMEAPDVAVAVAEENDAVTAGVSTVLSEYSFTTESDEETGITKREVILVSTAQSEVSDQEAAEINREAEMETAEEETLETVTETATEVGAEETEANVYQNRWNISLTEEEIDLLAKIVWLESSGESQQGQEAVIEVIFNRIASDKYPNTLYDVLSQGNPTQFCSWKRRDTAKPTEKEYQSIENVLSGNTNILRNDTLYFSTEPLTSRLDVRIGGHSFCY